MAMRIQLRRSTAAEWVAANPVLAQGELAIELDTKRMKIGDGTTPWNSLAYPANSAPSFSSLTDIDLTNLTDGSVLVYDISINKWTATNNLEKQNINGGFW